MNTVILSSDGHLVLDGKAVDTSPLRVLGARICLMEDCTLRTWFRMIDTHLIYQDLNPFIPECLAQYRSCPESGCFDPDTTHLSLTKTIEMIGFPGKPRLEIYTSLAAVQKSGMKEIRFFPLETLLDSPLRLGKLKHIIFGDQVDLFEYDTIFTLFEFIDAIVWELSFHGSLSACEIRR
ncbi:MAG: hypothetical protein AB7S77_13970 [Desulfatirhabdiaceae bacterium]